MQKIFQTIAYILALVFFIGSVSTYQESPNLIPICTDNDVDNYYLEGGSCGIVDCNDDDFSINPDATEILGDGIDQNCDNREVCYVDADNDNYRLSSTIVSTDSDCMDSGEAPVTDPIGDCNDANAAIKPGATEVCDGIDNNCDGSTDNLPNICGIGSSCIAGTCYVDECQVNSDCGDPVCNYCNLTMTGKKCQFTISSCDDGKACTTADTCSSGICSGSALAQGTLCYPASCASSSILNLAKTCDGAGNCADRGTQFCSPFICSSSSCRTTCSQNADCATGYTCFASNCLLDSDGDIVPNIYDNCVNVANSNQADADADGKGNVCDNCIGISNPDQADADADGKGNVCDNCVTTANPDQADVDGDLFGNSCDNCIGISNPDQADVDGDLFGNSCDNCVTAANSNQANADGDLFGNSCDLCPNSAANDADSDGFCAGATFNVPKIGASDCNDATATIYPGAIEICDGADNNCNTLTDDNLTAPSNPLQMGVCAGSKQICGGFSGWFSNYSNITSYESNEISCDGIDNDCDTVVDEGVKTIFFQDLDGDTFGNMLVNTSACTKPAGYVTNNTDCSDVLASVHPGASEMCNGADDDCDTIIDDNLSFPNNPMQAGVCAGSKQTCGGASGWFSNYSNISGYEASEASCDAKDNDCDATVDENVKTTFYRDVDSDLFGVTGSTTQACTKPAGYAFVGGDCNDVSSSINPNATEIVGDQNDHNCDGKEICYVDVDNDNYRLNTTINSNDIDCWDSGEARNVDPLGDCNDALASVYPGATEIAGDQIDQDCKSWKTSLNIGWNLISPKFGTEDTNTNRTILLTRGWNLIGYSSNVSINWSNSYIANGSQAAIKMNNITAIGKLIQPTIYSFENNSYRPVSGKNTYLNQSKGYWVYALVDNLSLILPNVGGSLSTNQHNWMNINIDNGTQISSLNAAETNGQIQSTIYYFDQQYKFMPDESTTLNSWRGYWVYSYKDNLSMIWGDE